MELDREISEYMQDRVKCVSRITCALVSLFLINAVFLCLYIRLQHGRIFNLSLAASRRCVIAFMGILFLCQAVFTVYSAISAARLNASGILYRMYEYKDSGAILREAAQISLPVLRFRILTGVAAALLFCIVSILLDIYISPSDIAQSFSQMMFMVGCAVCAAIIIPAADRIHSYRLMMKECSYVNLSPSKKRLIVITASVFVSLSNFAYLYWHYFRNNRDISWIVFPIAIVLGCCICTLFCNDKDS